MIGTGMNAKFKTFVEVIASVSTIITMRLLTCDTAALKYAGLWAGLASNAAWWFFTCRTGSWGLVPINVVMFGIYTVRIIQ